MEFEFAIPRRAVEKSTTTNYAVNNKPRGSIAPALRDIVHRSLGEVPESALSTDIAALGVARAIRAATEIFDLSGARLEPILRVCAEADVQLDPAMVRSTTKCMKTSFAGWTTAIAALDVPSDHPALAFFGLEVLRALLLGEPLPDRIARHTRHWLSTHRVQAHAAGIQPAGRKESRCFDDLSNRQNKTLIKVKTVLHLSTPKGEDFQDRARSQLACRAAYPSLSARTGAFTHRELSPTQLQEVLAASVPEQAATWQWVGIQLTLLTGLTIDLLSNLPLWTDKKTVKGTGISLIDGLLVTDLTAVAKSASERGSPRQGGYMLHKPLPAALTARLRADYLQMPTALVIGDLYPSLTRLRGHDAVLQRQGERTTSWARLHNSAPALCISTGLDSLAAAVLTNDFGTIPRSKLYYFVLNSDEIWSYADHLYRALGWSIPSGQPPRVRGFGTRANADTSIISEADAVLTAQVVEEVEASNGELLHTIKRHNSLCALASFRLALVLGLRETRCFDLWADIALSEPGVLIKDKSTRGVRGSLPAPLSGTAKNIIHRWIHHCSRLRTELPDDNSTAFIFHWLDNVNSQKRVHLLQYIDPRTLKPHPVGTSSFVHRLPDKLRSELAPDFGRKFLENALRRSGLHTSDVDAALRHDVDKLSRSSLVTDGLPFDWCQRVGPAIDDAASTIFNMTDAI